MKTIVCGNRLTVREEEEEEVEMPSGSCHTVLMEDLRMNRVSAKLLPRLIIMISDFSICENLFKILLLLMK
jgi:hypothetical protein